MRREKGSGSIYKRDGSPVWWIKYHRHGRPFRESARTTDWKKAGRMLKTRLSELSFIRSLECNRRARNPCAPACGGSKSTR